MSASTLPPPVSRMDMQDVTSFYESNPFLLWLWRFEDARRRDDKKAAVNALDEAEYAAKTDLERRAVTQLRRDLNRAPLRAKDVKNRCSFCGSEKYSVASSGTRPFVKREKEIAKNEGEPAIQPLVHICLACAEIALAALG